MFQKHSEAAAAGADEESRRKHQRTGANQKGAGEAQVEKTTHKMLWSLDSRMRHMEGQVPSYFLTEGDKLLIPALEQANKNYDSKLKKGTPHPDGPRRTTLAAAALNAIAEADIDAAEGEAKEQIEFFDKLAAMTKSPTIKEQQWVLKTCLQSYTTAQKMETEILTCQFFATKKQTTEGKKRYFFALEFSPTSPLRHTVEFARVVFQAIGAKPTDGPPPLGPIIRDIPRHK